MRYRVGGGPSSNIGPNVINSIGNMTMNVSGPSSTIQQSVKDSLSVNNPLPGIGGAGTPSVDQIRQLTRYNFASQNRAVTIKDYEAIISKIPGQFGAPYRQLVTEEQNKIQVYILGLDFFDAVNHALTTTSTGGFSTKQQSIAAFNNPWVETVIVLFMLAAGTNFTLIYFGLKLKLKKLLKNDEFKWFILSLTSLTIILTLIHFFTVDPSSIVSSFRVISFQVVSVITTTGYATADYTFWGSFMSFIFFLFLFSGASAGSTSGGIKIVRIILLIKNGLLEFKRRLHPKAIIPLILNGNTVSGQITYNLLAFIFLYLFIFTLGSLILTVIGVDFLTSISAAATAIGNVGPGIGSVGPSASFSHLPDLAKWVLSLLMLMGRLELFTVCVLFTPYFWKRI